jgi:NadR type nicotinamide-nucleotide adenylyltransferase
VSAPLRVAILGTESSGKSTLAAALATHYGTLWVPEYLREFVDTHDRVPLAGDQFTIAAEQCAREDAAAAVAQAMGGKYLFCDTTPLMTAVYSRHYFGGIDRELAALVAARRYDVTLVTAPDIPWVADGLQRACAQVSRIINDLLMEELQARAMRYHLIEGSPQQRLAQATQLLE